MFSANFMLVRFYELSTEALGAVDAWESGRKRLSSMAATENSGREAMAIPMTAATLWAAVALEPGETKADLVGSRLIV